MFNDERLFRYLRFYVGKEVCININDNYAYATIRGFGKSDSNELIFVCEVTRVKWDLRHFTVDDIIHIQSTHSISRYMQDLTYIVYLSLIKPIIKNGTHTFTHDEYDISVRLQISKSEQLNEKINSLLYEIGGDTIKPEDIKNFFEPPVNALVAYLRGRGVAVSIEQVAEYFN